MDGSDIRHWAYLIGGILASIVIADRITAILVDRIGLTGSAGFLAGFILSAILFFTILAIIEKATGLSFFRFSWQRD